MRPLVDISIIIPVYNEAELIGSTLEHVRDYCKQQSYDYEIIVVDDGSTDETKEKITSFLSHEQQKIHLLENERNLGKGAAIRRGVLASSKNWVLYLDADLSLPIEYLDAFLSHAESDIIIGSKFSGGHACNSSYPWHRRAGSRMFNYLVRIFLIKGIKDTQCGFKLFRGDIARRLFALQTIAGYGFDIEILYLAQKYGYHITEQPISFRHRRASKVKFISAGLQMARDIIKIKLQNHFGMYPLICEAQK